MSSLGLLFGLAAAFGWGTSDFFAGFATRRSSALATLVVAQAVALAVTLPALLVVGEQPPSIVSSAWAVAAGVAAFGALLFLYRGFAVSSIGPVVALAAIVGVAMPVVVGPLTGDQLRPTDVLGIASGVAAIVLVTRPGSAASIARAGIIAAIVSGLSAGFYFVLIRHSMQLGGGTWWTIIASRSIVLVLALALTGLTRQARTTMASVAAPMAGVGLSDLVGTACFILASAQGALSIAAVMASQSPAVTTILARVFLGQRLAREQAMGIALALLGMALIATR